MGIYNGNPIDECLQINDDLGAIMLHLMKNANEIGGEAKKHIAEAVGCLVNARCYLETARHKAISERMGDD